MASSAWVENSRGQSQRDRRYTADGKRDTRNTALTLETEPGRCQSTKHCIESTRRASLRIYGKGPGVQAPVRVELMYQRICGSPSSKGRVGDQRRGGASKYYGPFAPTRYCPANGVRDAGLRRALKRAVAGRTTP